MTHGSRAVDIMCNGSGSVQQYNAMTNGTHKPSEFVQTHGRWRNGSEFRTHTQADDHATDTMTGTAHMLRAVRGNVQRRMFHVLRLTYWSATP